MNNKNLKKAIGGSIIGLVNGLFGAGGGILAVPILRKSGLGDKEAHASSVAVILPLSAFSLALYFFGGRLHFSDGLQYILPGLLGAAIGTGLLKRLSGVWLHRIFGLLIIFAGVRFFIK